MMTHEQAVESLATYALDAVEGEEREAIEQHLADCPRCRVELDAFREVTTALGNSVEPVPAGLWSGIASRLTERPDDERPPMPRLVLGGGGDEAAEASPAAARRHSARARGRIATIGAVAVAAAAVVAVLAISLVHADNEVSQLHSATAQGAPSAVVSALEAPGHKVVNLTSSSHHRLAQFVVDPDGRGYLVSSTLPALSAAKTYQLWGVIGGQPISLGLLGQSPNQSTFTMAGSDTASTLAITVEPAGGTAVPTGSMVAQGMV